MNANVGVIDRLVRVGLGVILFLSPLLNVPAIWESQTLVYASMAVGLILVATGLFSFCPLYRVLGIGTKRS